MWEREREMCVSGECVRGGGGGCVYYNQGVLRGGVIFIGASLSEPHTSVTALQDVCVCMSACGHIPKI